MSELRSMDELLSSGLLWLVNKKALHPLGVGLAVTVDEKGVPGWFLTAPSMDGVDENARAIAAEGTLAQARLMIPAQPTLTAAVGATQITIAQTVGSDNEPPVAGSLAALVPAPTAPSGSSNVVQLRPSQGEVMLVHPRREVPDFFLAGQADPKTNTAPPPAASASRIS